MENIENLEIEDVRQETDDFKAPTIREILNGSLLTRGIILKNIGFVIWLTLLGIVYIGNSYHAEKVARTITVLQAKMKELRAESITTASELLRLNRQSKVQQMVNSNRLELKESVEPPYKIKD